MNYQLESNIATGGYSAWGPDLHTGLSLTGKKIGFHSSIIQAPEVKLNLEYTNGILYRAYQNYVHYLFSINPWLKIDQGFYALLNPYARNDFRWISEIHLQSYFSIYTTYNFQNGYTLGIGLQNLQLGDVLWKFSMSYRNFTHHMFKNNANVIELCLGLHINKRRTEVTKEEETD